MNFDRVASHVASTFEIERLSSKIERLAAEALEVSFWDMDEAEDVDAAYDHARKETNDEDRLESSLNLLMRKIKKFIDEIKRHPLERKSDDSDVVTSVKPLRSGPPPAPKRNK